MEEWEEFREEACPALGGEGEVEAPEAGAENGEVVVYVLAWGHPVMCQFGELCLRNASLLRRRRKHEPERHTAEPVITTYGRDFAFQDVRVGDVFEDAEVEGPLLL